MKYFVLSPYSSEDVHRKASQAAIEAYAKTVESTHPMLARDLRDWINQE
jgi:hypothetical protein